MVGKKPTTAVTLFVRHLIAKALASNGNNMSAYAEVVAKHGRVSRPHLSEINAGKKNVGPEVEEIFAAMHFNGSRDALKLAAEEYVVAHPELAPLLDARPNRDLTVAFLSNYPEYKPDNVRLAATTISESLPDGEDPDLEWWRQQIVAEIGRRSRTEKKERFAGASLPEKKKLGKTTGKV